MKQESIKQAELQGEEVAWNDYFNLCVLRETLQGSHKYFEQKLRIPEHFELEDLLPEQFSQLPLTEQERKLLSLDIRKIILRHKFFKGPEFERIAINFASRLSTEKDQLLTFSTSGGGIYLFMYLLQHEKEYLREKKLICYTSEYPLKIIGPEKISSDKVSFIYRADHKSYFKNFPSLWGKSHLIDLSGVHEA